MHEETAAGLRFEFDGGGNRAGRDLIGFSDGAMGLEEGEAVFDSTSNAS